MKKWVLLCAAALLFTGVASAHDFPKAEVFGGYSFAHLGADGASPNFNAGSASAAYNLYPWPRVVGDFGGSTEIPVSSVRRSACVDVGRMRRRKGAPGNRRLRFDR